jgi:Flp pilus assembly protein TadB
VTLTASIRLGEASDKFDADVVMGDPPGGYDFTYDIAESVDAVANEVSGGSAGSRVTLPEKTSGGVKLAWSLPAQRTALFAPFLFLLIGVVVYRRRYARIDREIAAARESVERDFPDFLDKLVLLLNAGVVISSAISKIAYDYRERREAALGSYFYDELCRMEDRIDSSRVSLMSEFAELAAKSGRREVMRFSAILADNIDKGGALAEKLAQESGALWDMRKKSAEKKGRIAETKLTFPMMLQLVAIILITVAPAVIEMR